MDRFIGTMDLRGRLNNWITDFLADRKQEVVMQGVHSRSTDVNPSRNATVEELKLTDCEPDEHPINHKTLC